MLYYELCHDCRQKFRAWQTTSEKDLTKIGFCERCIIFVQDRLDWYEDDFVEDYDTWRFD